MTYREILKLAANNLGLTQLKSISLHHYRAIYGGSQVSVVLYRSMSKCFVNVQYNGALVLAVAYSIDHKRKRLNPDMAYGISTNYRL